MPLLLTGAYIGVVESNADPDKLGRIRVRVPAAYGPNAKGELIASSDLPWAWQTGLPSGTNDQSGGITWIPNAGDQVIVMFLDGEPEKPVWSWGPRTIAGSKSCTAATESSQIRPIVDYDDKGKLVTRKMLSCYNQSVIMTPTMMHLRNAVGDFLELSSKDDYALLSTAYGYSVSCSNSSTAASEDGSVTMRTALGSYFSLDDSVQSAILNATTLAVVATDINVSATDVDITASGSFNLRCVNDLDVTALSFSFTCSGQTSISSGTLAVTSSSTSVTGIVHLGSASASDPVARLSDLNLLWSWLVTHTHGNGNMGSPTTAPIVPPLLPSCSSMVYTV